MDHNTKGMRADLGRPSGTAGVERVTSNDLAALEQRVVAALRTIYDPEIPVNIYDLGLVYELRVGPSGSVKVRMTLTAPGCPVAQSFPGTVEQAIRSVRGVTEAHVELVWDPPWSRERMSEAARLELGML
jgi:FeS assembly SUF system protein